MQWLARVCVERPVFTWVISLTMIVLGVAAFGSLPVDRFPNIDVPAITVSAAYPGASPEQVETEVTDVLEEAVNSVSGLSELTSTSYEGLSVVFVQFDLEVDVDVAAQEVRDRVNRVLAELPSDVDPPQIAKIDPDAAPLLYVAVRGPGEPQELTQFVDEEIKQRLEGKGGVGSVQILGGREREIQVELDPIRLEAQGLGIADVRSALMRENMELPGGDLSQGATTLQVRVPGRVESAAGFADLPVARRGGHVVRVGDVAEVRDAAAEVDSIATHNGEQVVLLAITRQSGTNAIAVADAMREELDLIGTELPPGYAMDVVRDESIFPRAAVHAVQEHLVLGAIFAIFVVLIFLKSFRSTVIAALAIPVSIIGTFAVLGALGLTLNVITLLALTLAVGIVIDDAIVILENVVRFLEERKLDPKKATIEATKDIGLAVLATTLSLVAVFLPVAFMDGIIGRFLSSFGATMTSAILVSMLVAFSLTPMLTAKWLKRGSVEHGERPHPPEGGARELSGAEEKARYDEWLGGRSGIELQDGWLERGYGKLLAFCMRRRWVVGIAIALTFGSMWVVGPHVTTSFLPTDDEGRFEITVEAPQGTSLASTELIAERMARAVREASPAVEHTILTVGSPEGSISGMGDNEALIYVALSDPEARELTQTDVEEIVRADVLPAFIERHGLDVQVSQVSAFGSSGAQAAPIQFVVKGPDLGKLEEYSDALAAALREQPGVTQAGTTLEAGRPELQVAIDRPRAAELGVSVADIADTLRVLVGGMDVTTVELDGEQYDVQLRAGSTHRRSAADLEAFRVRASDGSMVALSQVTQVDEGESPSAIQHHSRQRSVLVYAMTAPGASTGDLIATLQDTAESLQMPSTYSTALAGQAKEFGKAAMGFVIAILLSLVFMYLVIAAQFESWLLPLSIMSSLPLTVPFALISLLIFGQSLNIFSALGLLVLFGIVKKNSILQVDHMLALQKEGFSRPDAVMIANRDRLRPILMTTFAFCAGMIPLMMSSGAGSGTNHAIGGIVLGGQSLALLLTLVGTPVIYTWLDDLRGWTSKKTGALRERLASLRPRRAIPVAEE